MGGRGGPKLRVPNRGPYCKGIRLLWGIYIGGGLVFVNLRRIQGWLAFGC